MDSEESVDIF